MNERVCDLKRRRHDEREKPQNVLVGRLFAESSLIMRRERNAEMIGF